MNELNRKVLMVVSLFVWLLTRSLVLSAQPQPVELVNPFVDTHNSRWFYFSSACRPFGMVNLSPDTDTDKTWSSGYLYGSKYIRCFSHIHAWQLAGVAVMPATGEFKGYRGMEVYKSVFSHNGEIAKPGYHRVFLDDYQVLVELTSSTRVGFHRYTFPEGETRHIIFDTGAKLAHAPTVFSKVWKVNEKEIAGVQVIGKTGRRPKEVPVYFVAQLNQPIQKFKGWEKKKLLNNSLDTIQGVDAGAAVFLSPGNGEPVLMKVAISYVSVDQARKNLECEIPHWDFDRVVQESYDCWNDWLGRIQITGGTYQQQAKFYTDLWHALLGRRIVSDADGKYMDRTGEIPRVRSVRLNKEGEPMFPHYNFDALWGSHWSLNILWSMVYPEVMDGFCNTMVDMYENGGLIPRGPSGGNYTFVMIGDPAAPFFASAFNKGIRNYDVEKAYEGLRKNAFVGGIRDHAGYEHNVPAFGGGMQYYITQGWVPEGIDAKGMHLDGAAMTLEYAYQDWCLAQMAKALGKNDDYEYFIERSTNYRNLWDPEMKLMHPREKDGSWIVDFHPVEPSFNARGFCESNSAIYTHFVPHNMGDLIRLFGGNDVYTEFLNGCFEKGKRNDFVAKNKNHASSWVDYGNQPGTAMAHLFNYAGAPWLSQKWVREVKEAFGAISPYDGYKGDEDQGQMGALGVLMAMGLFEVDGGSALTPYYEITSPIFDEIRIQLNNDYYPGKEFRILTRNNGADNVYIQSAKLNGKVLDNCWFWHEDFARGGVLEIELGSAPNRQWGVEQLPPGR